MHAPIYYETPEAQNFPIAPLAISSEEREMLSKATFLLMHDMVAESALKQNFLVSPKNLLLTLGMALTLLPEEAREKTLDKLGLSEMGIERVHALLRTLLQEEVSNLLVEYGVKIPEKEAYNLQFFYKVQDLYFDPSVTRESIAKTVNEWVNQKSKGRIPNIVEKGDLKEMCLVLVNAITFDALFETPFDAASTQDAPFTSADGSVKEIPFMSGLDLTSSSYGKIPLEIDGKPAILPFGVKFYQEERYAAIFIDLSKQSTSEAFKALCLEPELLIQAAKQPKSPLFLKMPKIEASYENRDILENLSLYGLKTPFSWDHEMRLGKIVQKVFLKIDEKGTEAAAVTAAIITKTSYVPFDTLVLDGPFLTIILDLETNLPLFASLTS